MTRQRLRIISASDRSCVASQLFEISFVTVTTLNLEKFLIYGGKKIRKKIFISPLLCKRAGETWHFHAKLSSCRHTAGTVPALPARVLMAGSSRMLQEGQGTRHRRPELRVLLLRATYFISLPLPLLPASVQAMNCETELPLALQRQSV